MGENAELSDFGKNLESSLQVTRGVILERSSSREYLPVGGRATVSNHNNINVEGVTSVVVCQSCGEAVIVQGSEGDHTGSGSVHSYTYAPVGHCIQCGEWCEAWVHFTVDGTNLRLNELKGQNNCKVARIVNLDRFKQF